MKKLIDVVANPSGFDSLANYTGELPEEKLLVVMTRSRDSGLLTESNWDAALEMLGGESDAVEIHRFGHWACGWWEALCVVQGSQSEAIGQNIVDKIESYPVLDEYDFSERETEEANDTWLRCYNKRERLKYIRNNRSQFDFHDFKDLLAQVRGEYFGGYASGLIN